MARFEWPCRKEMTISAWFFLGFCTLCLVGVNVLVVIADPFLQMSWNKVFPLVLGNVILTPLIGMWFVEFDNVTPCKDRAGRV